MEGGWKRRKQVESWKLYSWVQPFAIIPPLPLTLAWDEIVSTRMKTPVQRFYESFNTFRGSEENVTKKGMRYASRSSSDSSILTQKKKKKIIRKEKQRKVKMFKI